MDTIYYVIMNAHIQVITTDKKEAFKQLKKYSPNFFKVFTNENEANLFFNSNKKFFIPIRDLINIKHMTIFNLTKEQKDQFFKDGGSYKSSIGYYCYDDDEHFKLLVQKYPKNNFSKNEA